MFSLRMFLSKNWANTFFSLFGLGLILTVLIDLIPSNLARLFLGLVFISGTALIFSVKDVLFFNRISDEGLILNFNKPKKAIIFTIGFRSANDDSILYKVCEKLNPEFIGFLETQETNNKGVVKIIVDKLKLKDDTYKSMIVDPTSIDEIKTNTNHIVNWIKKHNVKEKDILLDLTASTALMSVASFIAADNLNIDTLYLFSKYDDNNQPIEKTQKPILLRSYEMKK